jgi:hypothetical protein
MPAHERTHTLQAAADDTGLEPALIQRVFLSMGFNAGSVERLSDDDLELLRHVAVVLATGFPLVALLQLVRVYGQALAQMADAEVRLFHLYVHEPLMREGVPGVRMGEEMEELARELLPLASPIMDRVHQRFLAHFVEQECAAGYLRVVRETVLVHGVPLSIYMDRHGSLRRNDDHWTLEEELRGEQDLTQPRAYVPQIRDCYCSQRRKPGNRMEVVDLQVPAVGKWKDSDSCRAVPHDPKTHSSRAAGTSANRHYGDDGPQGKEEYFRSHNPRHPVAPTGETLPPSHHNVLNKHLDRAQDVDRVWLSPTQHLCHEVAPTTVNHERPPTKARQIGGQRKSRVHQPHTAPIATCECEGDAADQTRHEAA